VSDAPNTPLSASQIINNAIDGSALKEADPRSFIEVLIDVTPSLAAEFACVQVTIDQNTIPLFCEVLRHGQLERTVAEGIDRGIPEADLRDQIDPKKFELPKRIEGYAHFHQAVELKLPSKVARLMVVDLATGLGVLDQTTSTARHPDPTSSRIE
jgi:hypothetical protein